VLIDKGGWRDHVGRVGTTKIRVSVSAPARLNAAPVGWHGGVAYQKAVKAKEQAAMPICLEHAVPRYQDMRGVLTGWHASWVLQFH
jgi:hypothetical protein